MKKLVVLLLVLLALFTFIRDFPSATTKSPQARSSEMVASPVP